MLESQIRLISDGFCLIILLQNWHGKKTDNLRDTGNSAFSSSSITSPRENPSGNLIFQGSTLEAPHNGTSIAFLSNAGWKEGGMVPGAR
jgi:hypothetical protein